MIEIVILDDHNLVLEGIASMLAKEKTMKVVKTLNLGKLLLTYLEDHSPNVLLLDINLPDISGLDLCKEVSKKYPSICIIGLSNYNETGFIKNMMKNGAKGYLQKNTSKEELIEAINVTQSGEVYLPKSIKEKLLNESFGVSSRSFIPVLTRREKEILACIADELTNTETAEKLFISVKTVEAHRNNLLQKFDVRNTAGLIRQAMTKGLIS